jgi:hypothetical protein
MGGGYFIAAGGTGDPPVPPGRWPGGRSMLPLFKSVALVQQSVALHSGRRVADRNRQVARATPFENRGFKVTLIYFDLLCFTLFRFVFL